MKIFLTLITLMITTFSLSAKQNIAYYVQIDGSDKHSKITVPVERLEQGQYLTNSIYVKTKERVGVIKKKFAETTIQSSISDLSVSNLEPISHNPIKAELTPASRLYQLTYEEPIDSYDLCMELMENPAIEYAVPVFVREVHDFVPNDPRYSNQWHLANIEASKAWEITQGDEEVIIGIVDSGTQWSHEDLSDRIYINTEEIPNNGQDDDNNGYVDDVRGWDFVGSINISQAIQGQYNPDNDPSPGQNANSHGTHVAGCAAPTTNNNTGVAGIGFKCKIMPIKCGSDQWNSTRGIYRAYAGILYAAENGADIINCSWGGPGYSPAEQEIINSAVEMGSLVVVSAGNDNSDIGETPFYPAAYDNVLCVGAIRSNNRRSGFSNYGYRVDVFGPGSGILSTIPNGYGNSNGTSMSGPIVAGLAALVKSLHPDWTPHQIAAQLRSTTLPLNGVSGADKPRYFGRVNANNALTSNSNGFTQNRVPGMLISETAFSEATLDSYDFKNINLKLVNLLAPVDGVRLDFLVLDQYAELEDESVVLNNLETMDTADVNLSVKLTDMNPWYDGFVRILVVYTANNYEDFQLLQVPISVESRNLFSVESEFLEDYRLNYLGAHSPSRDAFWTVGYSAAGNFGVYYNTNVRLREYSDPMTSVYGIDQNEAWVTTGRIGNTGSANILHTTDAGLNWDVTSGSNITSFFNGIYFFDDNNGIAIGDPQNGAFRIMKTSTGGNSWQEEVAVTSNNNEAGLVDSWGAFGERFWFGTTSGRVVRSRDMGNSWTAHEIENAAVVIDVAFESNRDGIAVYRQAGSSVYFMARSDDGGLNWDAEEAIFDTQFGFRPVSLQYNADVEKIFAMGEKGQLYATDDLGRTWEPVLTQYSNVIQRGALSNEFDQFAYWSAGEAEIGKLNFNMIPEGAEATLTTDVTEFSFDTTAINKAELGAVTLTNSGNLTIIIDDVVFENDEEENFSLAFGGAPDQVTVGTPEQVRLRFLAKTPGFKQAQMIIKSNNEDGDIAVNLSGFAFDPTSVEIERKVGRVNIYPNPFEKDFSVELDSKINDNISITIMDMKGSTIKTVENITLNQGINNIDIELNNIASGNYIMRFDTKIGSFIKRIVRK